MAVQERRIDPRCRGCGRSDIPVALLENGSTYCDRCTRDVRALFRLRTVGGRASDFEIAD
jgi:hypothetical protein